MLIGVLLDQNTQYEDPPLPPTALWNLATGVDISSNASGWTAYIARSNTLPFHHWNGCMPRAAIDPVHAKHRQAQIVAAFAACTAAREDR